MKQDAALRILTDLGDGAVTGGLALIITLALVVIKEKNAAWGMMMAFAITAATMALIKILFYSGCVTTLSSMHSPSGHSALSLAVYGMIAAIVSPSLPYHWRSTPYLMAGVMVLGIGYSRIALGNHSPAEVITGFAIGALVTVPLMRFYLPEQKGNPLILQGFPALMFLLFLLHGLHLPAETFLAKLGSFLHHKSHLCASV